MVLSNKDFANYAVRIRIAYARLTALTIVTDVTSGKVSYEVETELKSNLIDDDNIGSITTTFSTLDEAITQFNVVQEALGNVSC